jgi:hypothetical protein
MSNDETECCRRFAPRHAEALVKAAAKRDAEVIFMRALRRPDPSAALSRSECGREVGGYSVLISS